jgi:hypothetical protein
MDLRQYLIAPHERPQQQTARHDIPSPHHRNQRTTNPLDPRLAQRTITGPAALLTREQPTSLITHSHPEVDNHDGRSQQSQQQPQQHLRDQVVTREQVINGLAAYPDILAAILRSGHIPNQTPNDNRAPEQHIDTPIKISQATTTLPRQTNNNSAQTPAAASSPSSTSATKPSLPTSTTPTLCFWYYHRGSCVNDPASPTYKPSNRPCLYLHSTEGMQDIRVQQGQQHWHKRMADCGLELCRFSSNYKGQEEGEMTLQQKRNYRKWKSERKRLVRDAGLDGRTAAVEVTDGDDGDGVSQIKDEDQDVNASPQSTISLQDQDPQDTDPTTKNLPLIPTSPKAGRYAKGSRAPQPSAVSPIPTPSTLKRKGCVLPNQDTPTPASKKNRTGPSALAPVIQTMVPGSVVPGMSKSAIKQLKRQVKKAAEKTASNALDPNVVKMHSSEEFHKTNAKPLDVIAYTTSASTNFPTLPSTKPQQTCFLWYHDSCPKKGKKCTNLHALTNPPSYVVAPEGYIHEKGVCGRDWCAGDWRDDVEGEQGWEDMEGEQGRDEEDGIAGEVEDWKREGDEFESDDKAVEIFGDDEDGFGDEVEEGDHEHFTEEERDSYWDYKGIDPQSITKDDSGQSEDDASSEKGQ